MSAQSIGGSLPELKLAAERLIAGGLVAFPTETVYGLGAAAENQHAVMRMYKAKNRPVDHPVIIHVASEAEVSHWAQSVPDFAKELMSEFWPGPMTLILPRSKNAGDFVTGNQNSVGLRVPDNSIALKLLAAFHELGGKGVAAPSANRYGAVSPTSASAVHEELDQYLHDQDIVIDGGQSSVGLESTIIDCTKAAPIILRPGAITAEQIEACTKVPLGKQTQGSVRVSGSHKKHYSPSARVLVDGDSQAGEGLIALASSPTPQNVIRLAAPADEVEFARVLYAALRSGDQQGLKTIRILSPEGPGLALALRDRINRAASRD
jgi:L-threonylcarbamoyladenylate synthase